MMSTASNSSVADCLPADLPKPVRIGFHLIGGKKWVGGHKYQVNLFRALEKFAAGAVQPILFVGLHDEADYVAELLKQVEVPCVRTPLIDATRSKWGQAKALLGWPGSAWNKLLHEQRIDMFFENALFLGRGLTVPTVAWIPDFQHRCLPEFFSRYAWLRREIGLRCQINAGRRIMLSSRDAEIACHRFYPRTVGQTSVVRFAVPWSPPPSAEARAALLSEYKLPPRFFFLPNQFWKHKNHMAVVEALKICRDRGEQIRVVSTGSTKGQPGLDSYPDVQRRIEELQLQDSFIILGLVPYPVVATLFYSCIALLNPSRFEGWSTPVEEAKTAGIPTVLSNLGVHREQVPENGYFFDPQNPTELADVLIKASREIPDRTLDDAAIAAASARAENTQAEFVRRFLTLAGETIQAGRRTSGKR